jgi:hypothetical protein
LDTAAVIAAPPATVTGLLEPLTCTFGEFGGGGGGGGAGGGGGGAAPVAVIAALFAMTLKLLLTKNLTSYCPAVVGTTR